MKNIDIIGIDKQKLRKHILLYIVLLVLGNTLILFNFHNQDGGRVLAALGYLLVVISIIQLSFKLASLVTKKNLSWKFAYWQESKRNRRLNLPVAIWLILLVLLVAAHFYGFKLFGDREETLLNKNGIEVEAIILNREWHKPPRRKGYYQISYEFEYNGHKFQIKKEEAILQVGDSIIVKFLPDNPHNNTYRKKMLRSKLDNLNQIDFLPGFFPEK